MSRLQTLFLVLVLALWPGLASAQTTHSWVVSKITGTAFIASKEDAGSKVRAGMELEPGQTLSTKSRSRILLRRGEESMQVGPNAIIALPPAQYNQQGKTLILQQSGMIELTVNKQARQHFTVRTPFLSAVVKGTVFTVEVGQNRSNVRVSQGQVEVSNNASGETVQVTPGQEAGVRVDKKGVSKTVTRTAGKPMPVKVIKAKKIKPGFYATVKKNGKRVGLEPGSVKKTTSIDKARNKATSKENNGKSNASNKSGGAKSNASSNSKSNNGKGNGNSGNSNSNGNSGSKGNSGSSGNGNGNSGNNGSGNGNSGNNGNGNGNSGNNGNGNGNSGNNGNGNGNSGNNGNGNGKGRKG